MHFPERQLVYRCQFWEYWHDEGLADVGIEERTQFAKIHLFEGELGVLVEVFLLSNHINSIEKSLECNFVIFTVDFYVRLQELQSLVLSVRHIQLQVLLAQLINRRSKTLARDAIILEDPNNNLLKLHQIKHILPLELFRQGLSQVISLTG